VLPLSSPRACISTSISPESTALLPSNADLGTSMETSPIVAKEGGDAAQGDTPASQSASSSKVRSIEDFFGCLERPGIGGLSIEEIAKIAVRGWAGCR
ncbi:MAG TPA: hypothetical protein VE993_03550, partial [Stellaceae bacterium]|nr:hypothetical protein [Stellaceae bacterium]